MENLCRGHYWDLAGCPVSRGVPNSEVDLYAALCGWDTDGVLIREMSFVRFFFIERFHCIQLSITPLCH